MPHFEVDTAQARIGEQVFGQCTFCHGFAGVSGGAAPDLRASPIVLSDKAFTEVVKHGAKRNKGMPSFESLSDNQMKALQHYLREQANLVGSGSTKAGH